MRFVGELGTCSFCGVEYCVYTPAGGDGSTVVLYRHKMPSGFVCPGSKRPPRNPNDLKRAAGANPDGEGGVHGDVWRCLESLKENASKGEVKILERAQKLVEGG